MYTEYVMAIGYPNNQREEVLHWCRTTLASRLTPREGRELPTQSEVEHVLDYLLSSAAPTRLRRMSYEQARRGAEKWVRANRKRGRHIEETEADIQVLHEFADGSRIVRLLTKQAYEREGFLMSHCLGGYNPETTEIYSYRDTRNKPHATFEVSRNGKQIVQIKGKGNGAIHPRYIEPILAFLKLIGKELRPSEMSNLGYYHLIPEVREIYSRFVDSSGNGPRIVTLYGENYIT